MSTPSTSQPRLLWIIDLADARLAEAVATAAEQTGGSAVGSVADAAAGPAPADAVLLWRDRPATLAERDELLGLRVPVVLAGPTLHVDTGVWAEAAGLVLTGATRVHDVRVRPGRQAGPLADRLVDHGHGGASHLGEHVHVRDRVLAVDKVADDVDVLLTATLGLTEHPVATRRGDVLAWTLGTTAEAVATGSLQRLLRVATSGLRGARTRLAPLRAGLLGYGAIGNEHSAAFRAVEGLELAAGLRPEPRPPGRRARPGQRRPHHDRGGRARRGRRRRPRRGLHPSRQPRHVGAARAAGRQARRRREALRDPHRGGRRRPRPRRSAPGLLAVVYQNRRWDPDHLALRAAVRAGRLGERLPPRDLRRRLRAPVQPLALRRRTPRAARSTTGAPTSWTRSSTSSPRRCSTSAPPPTSVAGSTSPTPTTRACSCGSSTAPRPSSCTPTSPPRSSPAGTCSAPRARSSGAWRTERVVARNDVGTLAEDVLAPADSPPVIELFGGDGSVTRLATPSPAAAPVPPGARRPPAARAADVGDRRDQPAGARR